MPFLCLPGVIPATLPLSRRAYAGTGSALRSSVVRRPEDDAAVGVDTWVPLALAGYCALDGRPGTCAQSPAMDDGGRRLAAAELCQYGSAVERKPEILARLLGRAKCGCVVDEWLALLARLDGRLEDSPGVLMPYERRLRRLFMVLVPFSTVREGVVGSATALLTRFLLLRTVTLEGILWPRVLPLGDTFGGVLVGAGNLERADCTRSSSFCIFPIRPRI